MNQVYDIIAKDFSETRNRPWPEFDVFKKFIKKGAKILDTGCGNGRLLDSLKEFDVDYTGVDSSKNILDEARKKHPKEKFLKDDMRILSSLAGKRFDAIFLIASFHHLKNEKDRIKTLEKAKELLSDNGKIFMMNWNLFQKKYRKYVWESFLTSFISKKKWNDTYIPFTRNGKTTNRYYHAFTKGELDGLFKKTGLKIKKYWKGHNYCHILYKND